MAEDDLKNEIANFALHWKQHMEDFTQFDAVEKYEKLLLSTNEVLWYCLDELNNPVKCWLPYGKEPEWPYANMTSQKRSIKNA